MTFEEYNEKMHILEERLRATESEDEWDKVMDEINAFQHKHMEAFVEEYMASAKGNRAKEEIADIFRYAVYCSESGSAIGYVDSKELADEIDEIIWEEIGEYMLDAPQIYESNGEWAIDCMFGGNYIPEWDGWEGE